jgi:hypothetical protein
MHDLASDARRRTARGWRSARRDDRGDALGAGEDVEQVGDLRHHLAVFGDDLVLLEAGQALQAQLQDGLGLGVGQAVAVRLQAEPGASPSGRKRRQRRASISSTRPSARRAISSRLASAASAPP